MQIQTYHPSAYFSDDFSNSTISDNYWYENTETSWYGLNVNLGNGKLELTGTGTDLESWFDVNTKSILPVNEDWVIQADAYAGIRELQMKPGILS